jgi:glucan biosynthesis protein
LRDCHGNEGLVLDNHDTEPPLRPSATLLQEWAGFRCRRFLAGAVVAGMLPAFHVLAQEQPSQSAPAPMPPQNAPAAHPFSFDQLRELARKSASHPFQKPDGSLPDYLTKINYDHYRDIRFLRVRRS